MPKSGNPDCLCVFGLSGSLFVAFLAHSVQFSIIYNDSFQYWHDMQLLLCFVKMYVTVDCLYVCIV